MLTNCSNNNGPWQFPEKLIPLYGDGLNVRDWLFVDNHGDALFTCRHRGDQQQAAVLETWLAQVLQDYGDRVLPLDGEAAQLWGRLRVPTPHNAIDKQIAAIALLHDLTVVTRNHDDFSGTGVRLLNPCSAP